MARRLPAATAGALAVALGLALPPAADPPAAAAALGPGTRTAAGTSTAGGSLVVRVADHLPSGGRPGRSEVRALLRTPDGAHVPLPETAVRRLLAARRPLAATAPAAATPATPATATTAAVTPTAHTLTVLPVWWSAKDATTTAQLSTVAATSAAYWKKHSGGRVVTTSTVRGWKRIADPRSCDTDLIMSRALAAHGLTEPTTLTRHVLVYFPERSDCGGWAGLAGVGSWDILVNGAPYESVVAHEFGHNLGLGHANTFTCSRWSRQVAFGAAGAGCTNTEYADGGDVMGVTMSVARSDLSAAFADQLGWASVRTATATRTTYTLTNGVGSALRAVRVPTSGGGSVYLEYRPAATLESYLAGMAGVQARWLAYDWGGPNTELLDLKPQRGGTFASPAMTVGVPWPVPGTSLSALVTGTTATTATLVVGPTTGERTPPVVAAPTVAPAGANATVSWPAATDTGGTGVAAYAVLSGTAVVARVTAGTRSLTAPVAKLAAPVRVEATDWAGNTGSSTPVTSATGLAWNGFRPAAARVTGPAGTVAAGVVTVSWTTPDATAALSGWRVLVNGTEVVPFHATLPAASRHVGMRMRKGTWTVAVVPVSTVGVAGPARSVRVTVG